MTISVGLDDMLVAPTTAGAVRGERAPHGEVYRGIPYAEAQRYAPPEPVAPWAGIRACVRFRPDCPQPRFGRLGGLLGEFVSDQPQSEDCLTLNVWTPASDGARRPTMVWIHGGGFLLGSSAVPMYDGDSFARDGVVLVSVNYRLHALGFLYLDELFAGARGTGNLAIADQIAALRWVRENIASFGGDPDNVTVFGESAGAGVIGTLLGTPAADGLYQRAILQSGAGHHGLTPRAAGRVARRTLALAGVEPGDWDALRRVPVSRIVRAAARVFGLEGPQLLGDEAAYKVPFLPVIDGVVRDRRPIDHIANGAARDVDVLIGTCADEYRAFVWGLPALVRRRLPRVTLETCVPSADGMRAGYSAGRPHYRSRAIEAAIEGDHMFTIPAIRLAEAQHAAGGSVRMYRFAWATPVRGGRLGACHGLDVPFVFDNLDRARSLCGSRAPQSLARAMHGAWIRFAATGDPNGEGLAHWPSHETEDRCVMEFGERTRVVRDPGRHERLLWDGIW